MAQELFDELEGSGHKVLPGQLGENITVRGLDVLNLPQGTRLSFGEGGAVVQVRIGVIIRVMWVQSER